MFQSTSGDNGSRVMETGLEIFILLFGEWE